MKGLALGTLARLYGLATRVDRTLTRSRRLPRPVVSVGNVALGGRGKTPFVIELARRLVASGAKPVVLTRGYGRSVATPVTIDAASLETLGADVTGDEPLEIAWRAGVTVLVGAKRGANALGYLRAGGEATHFLLDDGFQHWALRRDFDVVLLDPADETDRLVPAGRLREAASAAARADLAICRDRDFRKRTRLRCAPALPPPAARIVSTRAPDPGFALDVEGLLGPRDFVRLPDHAPAPEMLRALRSAGATGSSGRRKPSSCSPRSSGARSRRAASCATCARSGPDIPSISSNPSSSSSTPASGRLCSRGCPAHDPA
mgnify:CR=1 FL=1